MAARYHADGCLSRVKMMAPQKPNAVEPGGGYVKRIGLAFQGQGDILDQRSPGQKSRVLKSVRKPVWLGLLSKRDLALEVGIQSGDDVERRRLARARRSEHAHEFAVLNLEREAEIASRGPSPLS